MCTPEENHPDSLLDICLGFCAAHLEAWCVRNPSSGLHALRPGLTLPAEICEALIRAAVEGGHDTSDSFFHVFRETQTTHLKRVCVRGSGVTDRSLGWLLAHNPIELDISRCPLLTRATRGHISKHGQRLQALFVGDSAHVCLSDDDDDDDEEEDISDISEDVRPSHHLVDTESMSLDTQLPAPPPGGDGQRLPEEPFIACPNLRAFSAHGLAGGVRRGEAVSLTRLLSPFSSLTYLDLSSCLSARVSDMQCITHFKNLVTLILYEVPLGDITLAFQHITALKALRVLDIGHGRDGPVKYDEPEQHLAQLVAGLPYLTRLDISGTNLSGFEAIRHSSTRFNQKEDEDENQQTSIPGLEGRYFDFLGLLGCSHDACMRDNIPARQVTGHASEAQVLLAIQTYVDKSELLVQSLNHLFQIFRFSACTDQRTALQAILAAMKRHPFDKHIQISGSASLFYIVKGDEKYYLSHKTKRRTISAILDGMDYHTDEATMMRNGCLTLCHFKIPRDVLFEYRRMVTILLRMVAPADQEEFVQRIGIFLLNSLSCQVDGKDKQLVGDLGAISTMLKIIQHKLEHGQCDEVMEIAWSTMWNVTDETAVNCERFIEEAGMELFLQCLQRFPGKPELLRNMMGLMGNVAEVAHLRPRLRQKQYVRLFSDLLDSESDGIEVSYNACGVLAHMVSDGDAAWLLDDPPRSVILSRMVHAINRWNIKTKRNINYRSFEPILRLLSVHDTPECQHWAIWALCNLTTMYPQKYCQLLEKESGLLLIQEVLADQRPYPDIRLLAQRVLNLCDKYRAEPDMLLDDGAEPDAGSDNEAMDG